MIEKKGTRMAGKKERRRAGRAATAATTATGGDLDRRSGADRRLHDRVLIDLEVDYGSDETFLFAYITDISAMGIFVRTLEPEEPGTHLNLRFRVAGAAAPLVLEGVVTWVNPYRPARPESVNPGMGVRFVNLTAGQREQLTQLVKTFAFLDGETGSRGQA